MVHKDNVASFMVESVAKKFKKTLLMSRKSVESDGRLKAFGCSLDYKRG